MPCATLYVFKPTLQNCELIVDMISHIGRLSLLALGLCATCYTLIRQDEEYLGGLREAVLECDDNRCPRL